MKVIRVIFKTVKAVIGLTIAAALLLASTSAVVDKTLITESETTTEPTTIYDAEQPVMTSPGPEIKEIDGITYVNGILVVNKSYSLPEKYAPGVNKEALAALNKMIAAAKKDKIKLTVISDYRSYESQKNKYESYVKESGKKEADRFSARPGHSEHQTGLAFDLNSLKESFAETKEGKWIAAHCSDYGFIVRYPKGKENITGYMYEPWHIRYLGVETAKAVYDSGLTLEEYLEIDSYYKD